MYYKMTAYVAPNKLDEYFENYCRILREKGFSEDEIIIRMQKQAKDEVVIAYTKEWMDENLNYWIDTIQNVPDGYWVVQDLIHQPHCEYEHYKWRSKMSYEKGNVGTQTAERELSPRSFEIYQLSKKIKNRSKEKITEYSIKSEIEVKKVPEEFAN